MIRRTAEIAWWIRVMWLFWCTTGPRINRIAQINHVNLHMVEQAYKYVADGTGGANGRWCWAGRRRGRLPAAGGVVLVGGQGVQVDADHGLAEPAGDLGHHVRVVVEGGGLHDRGGAPGGVAGL